MNLRQAAQQALEAIERGLPYAPHRGEFDALADAADDLRAALAEPEQKPVAWMDIDDNGQRLTVRQWSDGNKDEVPLYTAPTPRKPLTDEEIALIVGECAASAYQHDDFSFARAIERAHGIGGGE